jgi:hypothetical protein
LSRAWASVPLFLMANKQLALSAHFPGPAIPWGVAHANYVWQKLSFLSFVFCEFSSQVCCVSRLDVRLKSSPPPRPKNAFSDHVSDRGWELVLKNIYASILVMLSLVVCSNTEKNRLFSNSY